MTLLLIAGSVIALFTLLASAESEFSKAMDSDSEHRGPWGIVYRNQARRRDLDPHERRWQTALLSGKDNPARWRTVVSEIETLEYLANVTSSPDPPEAFDRNWIEERLANLEAVMEERTQLGAP